MTTATRSRAQTGPERGRARRPRVLVVGAQGVLGSLTARAFEREGWSVLRAGRRAERAADFRLVDLDRPESLAPACAGTDLVVSTVADRGLAAERAVLREGGTLLNVGSLALAPRRELERRPDGPGLVVLHAGMVPGVTTLALAQLLAGHPDANGVEIGFTAHALQSGGRGGVGFLFGQLARERRRPAGTVPFPEPFGRRRCLEFGRGEEGWFSGLPGRYDCRAWIYVGPPAAMAAIHALNTAGALDLLSPRLLKLGRGRLPRAASAEPKREWVAVLRDGERLAACSVDGRGDYAMTVGATLAFADAVVARRAAEPALRGVHGPESLFELDDLLPGLARRGIRIVPRDPSTGAPEERNATAAGVRPTVEAQR